MTFTEPFVLPAATVIAPLRALPEELQRAIGGQESDYAVSRSNSRIHSKVVDAQAASLLNEFRTPSTIAAAVARFSKVRKIDAELVLEEALPMLLALIRSGLLVPSDSNGHAAIVQTRAPIGLLGHWRMVRSVQSLEDSEIYQVRAPDGAVGALKIGISGPQTRRAIEREAKLLQRLGGTVTPTLLEAGEWQGSPYIITEWFSGTDAYVACGEFRTHEPPLRSELLTVTAAILRAYAGLHERGIIHGDVHPYNVLVDRAGTVKLIDFGHARSVDDDAPARLTRAGVSFFYDPELVCAVREGGSVPSVTASAEQYALAALLYLLVTGSHYVDFRVERNEMLRQIAEEPMLPFMQRGVAPWPAVERLLEKALRKSPEDRFASVADFSNAWESVHAPAAPGSRAREPDTPLLGVRQDVLQMAQIGGVLMLEGPMPPPSTSINYGSAGLAYAIHRIACATDSAELFALADVWSQRAASEVDLPGAFLHDELEIPREHVGSASLYHGPSGVYTVKSLIARARDDQAVLDDSIKQFAAIVGRPCEPLDLALGRTGALLGAALLLEQRDDAELRAVGNALLNSIWQTIDSYSTISESTELSTLGIAHGWAGILYATLCWCMTSGQPHPTALEQRLLELSQLAEPVGRGLQWRVDLVRESTWPYMPGWCNGSAGHVFLWTKAYRATGSTHFLGLAEGAVWHTWETPIANISLCCGLSGQAYALLNFYHHSGDEVWLRRARALARTAAGTPAQERRVKELDSLESRPTSLYKGDAGLAVLAADLERPADARMPMFECEV